MGGQQQQIIQLIDNYFEHIERKQRRIRFYEKEDVVRKSFPNGGTSTQKGRGNILLEVEIK